MDRKQEIVKFLKTLREEIIRAFEAMDDTAFQRKPWQHHSGGGGEIAILRGKVFEKAAVNWSGVSGDQFPMQDGSGPFFATGISLITHMQNPHAPTVHMNIRFIETENKHWFGGGYDLTPMGFFYPEDTEHFHQSAKQALDPLGKHLYPSFFQNAKEYFYIPHRKKERGIGGIFFDHFNTGNFEEDLKMWQTVGSTFLQAIMPIYERRIEQSFSQEEKERQLEMRAHYAEFNLMYDRGTKFGFQSGGNPEAILCSMPPLAKW
ncbi:MAG TPA: oxygen-dependent coproporphyrinogen oxidase [Rhabdochlamydiaceae bacterium]|nr:oxygen-dependent coproporphyrinogen oxidase [Rhabdochlamydiaceae bacterium]